MTELEPENGKTEWSWIVYGLGNVGGAVSMAIRGVVWLAAIFSVMAIICMIQLLVSARR